MNDSLRTMIDIIKDYYNNSYYVVLLLFSCVFLYFRKKSFRSSLFYPNCCIVFLLMIPYLYDHVYKTAQYWRFFWMIPMVIIIAYAFTELLSLLKIRLLQAVGFVALLVLVYVLGNNIFINGTYEEYQNPFKISQQTLNVCEYIQSINSYPLCLFPEEMFCQTRQYSAHIRQLYGRNAFGYGLPLDEDLEKVFNEMESPSPNYDTIFKIASERNCDFIVLENDKENSLTTSSVDLSESANTVSSVSEDQLYSLINTIDGYDIYQRSGDSESV